MSLIRCMSKGKTKGRKRMRNKLMLVLLLNLCCMAEGVFKKEFDPFGSGDNKPKVSKKEPHKQVIQKLKKTIPFMRSSSELEKEFIQHFPQSIMDIVAKYKKKYLKEAYEKNGPEAQSKKLKEVNEELHKVFCHINNIKAQIESDTGHKKTFREIYQPVLEAFNKFKEYHEISEEELSSWMRALVDHADELGKGLYMLREIVPFNEEQGATLDIKQLQKWTTDFMLSRGLYKALYQTIHNVLQWGIYVDAYVPRYFVEDLTNISPFEDATYDLNKMPRNMKNFNDYLEDYTDKRTVQVLLRIWFEDLNMPKERIQEILYKGKPYTREEKAEIIQCIDSKITNYERNKGYKKHEPFVSGGGGSAEHPHSALHAFIRDKWFPHELRKTLEHDRKERARASRHADEERRKQSEEASSEKSFWEKFWDYVLGVPKPAWKEKG